MFSIALALVLCVGLQDDRVSKLSAELGSPDAAVRERAAAEFVAMGRPALKTLRALEKDATDPEVRLRAAAASREIVEDLRRVALKIEVSTEKKTYQPGETVTVKVRLKNVEDFPVTIFMGEDDLMANAHSQILSGAKPVHIVVPTYQVLRMGPVPVDEKRFKTILPGESVEVHQLSFKERWDMKGKNPSLKASYQEAEKVALDPGTYRAQAFFSWGFKTKKEKRDANAKAKKEGEEHRDSVIVLDYTFTPKAGSLMSEAWEGALEGSVEFQVAKD